MQTAFSELSSFARQLDDVRVRGQVAAVTGLSLTAVGLERAVGVGQSCIVHGGAGPVRAEVVGVDSQGTRLLPFGSWRGVAAGDAVEIDVAGDKLRPDDSWIGRVIDALGQPLDGKGHLHEGRVARQARSAPPPAFQRRRVGAKLETSVKVLDIFAPICRGQRMGVFAGSGVGKSTMMAMLARNTEADVIVMALVGERGREVQDYIADDLGEAGMARSVLVVSTGDEPPLKRRQAAWTAMAVAEHFRDAGKHVLLLMDSVTRFAMAQREIGLASGEPPTAKGYPPTVFAELPQLLERAGPGAAGQGDITGVFTVLVDGDDMNDPVADAVRGITDGHIVLSRAIAERGRFPAVDVFASVSRLLPSCHSDSEYAVMRAAHGALSTYNDMAELIRIGAYRPGSSPDVDRAIAFFGPGDSFLSQRREERVGPAEGFGAVREMLSSAGVPIAEREAAAR